MSTPDATRSDSVRCTAWLWRFGVRCQLGWMQRLTPHAEHKATFRDKEFALALDKPAAKAHMLMLKQIAPHLKCRVLPLSRPNSELNKTGLHNKHADHGGESGACLNCETASRDL